MKGLYFRKDLDYLMFNGRECILTEDVCRLTLIANNQRIYNYTKKFYQNRIEDDCLKLKEGEDYIELRADDLIKFQADNHHLPRLKRRKSLKIWFDSAVEKIKIYKELDKKDIDSLKSLSFYKENLTEDLIGFTEKNYSFNSNQFLFKEISRINLKLIYLESEIQKLKDSRSSYTDLSNLIREYLLLKNKIK